jgi:hypothetical protein
MRGMPSRRRSKTTFRRCPISVLGQMTIGRLSNRTKYYYQTPNEHARQRLRSLRGLVGSSLEPGRGGRDQSEPVQLSGGCVTGRYTSWTNPFRLRCNNSSGDLYSNCVVPIMKGCGLHCLGKRAGEYWNVVLSPREPFAKINNIRLKFVEARRM